MYARSSGSFPHTTTPPLAKGAVREVGHLGENMLFLVKWDYVWDPCRVDVNITVVDLFLEAPHERCLGNNFDNYIKYLFNVK